MQSSFQPKQCIIHKLSESLIKNKTLSILQTSICSMERNAEKLETLISHLEFNFNIMAVFERWTSYSRQKIKPRIIDGYQTYHGTKKWVWILYKNGIKLRQQTDLDMNTVENNDFQSFWIEIINNSNLIFWLVVTTDVPRNLQVMFFWKN